MRLLKFLMITAALQTSFAVRADSDQGAESVTAMPQDLSAPQMEAVTEANVRLGGTYYGKVADFHPTQMTVGMREVQDKLDHVKKLKGGDLTDYLSKHTLPTVIGPGENLYIIDHHHLALALIKAGVDKTYYEIKADFSQLDEAGFWKRMKEKKWVYPYDQNGQGPYPYTSIPKSLEGLKDDPYRSLAGAVRDDGYYDKTSAPFMEFVWADYFRTRVKIGKSDDDFKEAVKQAEKLAHDPAASSLPGYNGK